MNANHRKHHHHRADLVRIATRTMAERGLLPEFSAAVDQQLRTLSGPAHETGAAIRDLTALLWCSIDNDDSLDLDQLTVSAPLPNGGLRLQVAITSHKPMRCASKRSSRCA